MAGRLSASVLASYERYVLAATVIPAAGLPLPQSESSSLGHHTSVTTGARYLEMFPAIILSPVPQQASKFSRNHWRSIP